MAFLTPIAFAVLVWWASTGLILRAVGPAARSKATAMLMASLALALGMTGVVLTRDLDTAAGAYLGFLSSVLVWAWQEVAFLLGVVTGPNRAPCPPVTGWRRAWYAFTAIAHHELALLLLGLAVLLPCMDAPNQVAAYTYAVLWTMRLSAKLNVFLGVKNFYEAFLPPSLHYLLSYFSRRRFNPLFPVSVGAASVVTVLVWWAAARAATPYQQAAMGLVGALLFLAVIEHWLLVIPMRPESLWRWAIRARD